MGPLLSLTLLATLNFASAGTDLRQARMSLESMNYEAAEHHLNRLCQNMHAVPSALQAEVYLLRGRTLAHLGQTEAARTAFQTARRYAAQNRTPLTLPDDTSPKISALFKSTASILARAVPKKKTPSKKKTRRAPAAAAVLDSDFVPFDLMDVPRSASAAAAPTLRYQWGPPARTGEVQQLDIIATGLHSEDRLEVLESTRSGYRSMGKVRVDRRDGRARLGLPMRPEGVGVLIRVSRGLQILTQVGTPGVPVSVHPARAPPSVHEAWAADKHL